ncbi:MAG: molybdopterin molybdotransferase MoeA [Gammaproteobacteria bacterium]
MTNNKSPEPSTCDTTAGQLLSPTEARRRILAAVIPLSAEERVPVRAALGRALSRDITSAMDVPPYDNSAMDGYALRGADLPASGERLFRNVGRALAGAPYTGQVGAGQCVRIMTGAILPPGTDTVVMQEHAATMGGEIRIGSGHRAGENVRRAGEDIKFGETVLSAGTAVLPAELGLLASLGIAEVPVTRRVRVAFFTTGDELCGLGETLAAGQIYDSNRYTLFGMLNRLGVTPLDMGVIRDRRADVRRALQEAAAVADVVITSGGVSVGEADYVTETLEELGEIDFWRIAMKPGKPLAVGRLEGAYFFGLPGNPVSAMATFYQFVQPGLRRLMGQAPEPDTILCVPCATDLHKQPGRLEYQRGILVGDDDGNLRVHSTGSQGSHVLTSMSRANCFIILPAESSGATAGELVRVQPFAGLM